MSRYTIKSFAGRATIFATTVLLLVLNAAGSAQAKLPWQADAPAAESKTEQTDAEKCAGKTAEKTAEKAPPQRVKAHILIKAPPQVVWDSVHEERQHDPDMAYSKVIEEGVNECKLEQKFNFLPVIGTATCLMHQREVPLQRIDYKLLKSDRFKAMEGSWVFTSAEDGKATLLELSTHLDMGTPVPKMIMNGITQKKIERRLAHVKSAAEDMHQRNLERREVAASSHEKLQ